MAQGQPIGTYGKDFWCGFMQNASGSQELRLNIASVQGASGTVSMPANGWSTTFTVPANGVANVQVPLMAQHMGSESVQNLGVHIVSSDSVSIGALNFQQSSSDAAQLITTATLGDRYRAEAYSGVPGWMDTYRGELLIVATADGTQVRITPAVATKGGHAAGVPFTVDLNAGQSYQVQTLSSTADLTGTLIEGTAVSGACRPFAVFGGSMCANVPSACSACDHVYEQMTPLITWGTSFHTIPLVGTPSYTFRVLADQNNTHVSIDGASPITLNAGERYERNFVSGALCINADQPVSVTQFTQGNQCLAAPDPNTAGDPSMVRLLPDEMMSRAAVFSTMPSQSSTIVHRLNVVVPTSGINTVYLDNVLISAAAFTSYTVCPGLSYASVTLTSGTHRLRCNAGFLAYIYGMTFGESYMLSVADRSLPVIPPNPVLCTSSAVTLNAPIALDNIQWTTSSAPSTVLGTGSSFTFTPDHNDIYQLDGTLPISGCPQHFEYPIGLPVQPALDILANGSSTAQVCQFSSVQLNAQPAPDPAWFDLTWTPPNDLSDPNIPDPVAYPNADAWYKLSVVSPVGCGSATDSVFVSVVPSDVYDVRTSVNDNAVCLGDQVTLAAKAERPIRSDVFNGAQAAWWSVQGGSVSGACGAVSGMALYFNGAGQRSATMGPVDLSTGGAAHFALKIATGAPPCDDAEAGEDVVLEYSVNGGTNWTAAATFNESAYPSFTTVHVDIPVLGAAGTNTLVRWRQLTNSGAGQDNWALDNLVLTHYDNAGLNWSWTPAAALTTPAAASTTGTPPATAWYHARTTTSGGCAYLDSVQVTVAPAFSILPINDTTRCGTPGTQLHAQVTSGSNIQWLWSPGNGSLDHPTAPDPIATPGTTTNYTVQATNSIGCMDTEEVRVTVSQLTAVSVSTGDAELCHGEHTTLQSNITAGAAYTISWSPSAGLSDSHAASPIATPTATTTYTCTVTDVASGCSLSDDVTIVVHGPYHLTVPNDTTICTALGLQLHTTNDLPAGSTIAWTPAENLNAANITAPSILHDSSATYHVTVTDPFGCWVTDSVRVNVAFDNLLTPVNVSTCEGQPLVLDAGFPGSTYDWTTGEHTQHITVSQPGQYTTTITDPQFCQAIVTFVAHFHAPPPVDLGPDTMLCGASSFVLDAHSPGNAVTWNTMAHTQQITVTASGTYSVQVTSPQGCESTDEVVVTLNQMPVDALQDVVQCVSQPLVLDAGNPGCTYTWSPGNAHTRTLPVTTSGTYSVTVTTPEGCNGTFNANVTLMPEVNVDLGPDTALCADLTLVLDAGSPALTHVWNTGASTQAISPAASGIYGVVVSNGYCSASDSIAVRFDPLPTDVLQDVTACVDAPVTLHAGNAGSAYLWSTGAQTEALVVSAPGGTRSVTVTTEHGCIGHFNADVQFVDYPEVELGMDTVLCAGEVLVLNAGAPGPAYTWNNGTHDPSLAVIGSGLYQVDVNNGYCISSDSIQVIFNPVPQRAPVHQLYTCMEEEPHAIAVDAGNVDCTYLWNTGETTQVITATSYGWHVVQITNAFGCSITDSIMVNEFCPPSLYMPNTFTPNGDGRNDTWQPVGNNVAELDLYVFDRWGGLVFHATDMSQAWDGTISGSPVANDIYVWRMTYKFIERTDGSLGFEHKEMGHVQVMR